MDQVTVSRELLRQAIEALTHGCQPGCESGMTDSGGIYPWGEPVLIPCPSCTTLTALRAALEQPAVDPVWVPIEQKYPQDKEIDILMADGSILCGVLPQSDGDLWWESAGTGERFIDPKYANVTHWRVHCEVTPPHKHSSQPK